MGKLTLQEIISGQDIAIDEFRTQLAAAQAHIRENEDEHADIVLRRDEWMGKAEYYREEASRFRTQLATAQADASELRNMLIQEGELGEPAREQLAAAQADVERKDATILELVLLNEKSCNVRIALVRFVPAMEAALKRNDHKEHWSHANSDYLLRRLEQEVVELRAAVETDCPGEIEREAADVANFAMMIADNATRAAKEGT